MLLIISANSSEFVFILREQIEPYNRWSGFFNFSGISFLYYVISKGIIMEFMLMAASLRKDSVNKKLIKLAAELLGKQNYSVNLADFSQFSLPLYNGDIQTEQGIPEAAYAFVKHMQAAQGLIIASPEYNFSIPGILKNLIDWVSRITPMPWSNQKVYLMSASPSLIGGNRGLWHTRVPLEACGAIVYPNMFSLASAYEAFTDSGEFKDAKLQQRLSNDLTAFVDFSRRLT